MEFIQNNMMLLVPFLLLQFALVITALIDWWKRPEGTLRGPKWTWLLVILVVNTIGPIIYFVVARQDE